MKYGFMVLRRRVDDLENRLETLKLLSLQIEGMDDPDDMRECVRGMIRFYKAELDELYRDAQETDEEGKDNERIEDDEVRRLRMQEYDRAHGMGDTARLDAHRSLVSPRGCGWEVQRMRRHRPMSAMQQEVVDDG